MTGASSTRVPTPETLAGLFYARPEELGRFEAVAEAELPQIYRELLDHANHMTVTVERFHGGPVDVDVLRWRLDGNLYSRKILLRRQSDRRVVQFGIVRLNFDCVSAQVRARIESRAAPLGRILIEHGMLLEIRLLGLWRVLPGKELRDDFAMGPAAATYGRTAMIDFDGRPAVELLEIVAPVESG